MLFKFLSTIFISLLFCSHVWAIPPGGGLTSSDVDDTPVNGVTNAPVSSNWAFDHGAAADPHSGYMLESNIGTGANNYLKLGAVPGSPDGTKYLRDDMTWAAVAAGGDITKVLGDATGDVDQLYQTATAFTALDATPNVVTSGKLIYKTADTTTFTDFDDGTDHTNIPDGQLLIILFQHAATLDFSSSQLTGHGGNDFVAADGDWAICVFDASTDADGQWLCNVSQDKISNFSEFTIPYGTDAAPTGEARVYHNSTTDVTTVGTGAAASVLAKAGTLTNSKWCTTDGTVISCTEDAPAGTGDITAVGSCTTGDCTAIGDGATGGGYLRFLEDSDNGTDYVYVQAADDVVTGRSIRFGTSVADVEKFAFTMGNNDNTITLATETGANLFNFDSFNIAFGADPGDSGAVRLSNNTAVSWEQSTPGTDIFIALDSSDIFHVGQNAAAISIGTSGTGNTTVVGDLTVTGADVSIGAAGVKLTGDGDGAITFLGLGDGSDEDLTLNLDDTVDTATFSSSTGVTSINFSALNMVTTGYVSAGINVIFDANDYSVTTTDARGGFGVAGGAGTWTLPAAVAGMSFCVYSTTAAAVNVDVDASDVITLNGTALSAGDKITSASAAGDFICLLAVSDSSWITLGRSGTWTDGN